MIDRVQVQQVLFNLVRNAIEAMADSARRELLISTRLAGDMIAIDVADSGFGIARLTPNQALPSIRDDQGERDGCGSSICRAIVEARGGEMNARDAPDGGTVFAMTLVRAAPPAAS